MCIQDHQLSLPPSFGKAIIDYCWGKCREEKILPNDRELIGMLLKMTLHDFTELNNQYCYETMYGSRKVL